jgi:Flp pilus assembly protein TadG
MDICAIVRRSVRRRSWARTGQDGQALIEFALVAPFLVALVFAIFDLGQALNYQNDETNLANVASRYAAVIGYATSNPTCNSTQQTDAYLFIKCEAQTDSSAFANSLGVCVTDETSANWQMNDAVKITIYYPYKYLGIVGNETITLKSSATMMLETTASSGSAELAWLNNTNTDSSNPVHTSPIGIVTCP